jgi:hypothetical protein
MFRDRNHPELIDAYLASTVFISEAQCWRDINRLDVDGTAYVLTAWNPGTLLSDSENIARNELLRDMLEKRGIDALSVRAGTDEHCEDSYLLTGITLTEAIEIARRFDQVAIFEVTATTWCVVMTHDLSRFCREW